MSSSSWWWPPNWPAPKGSEHLQRDYETSTTTNTTKNLEEERLIGRIGVLTKRVEQLETQFHGLYDSRCDLMTRKNPASAPKPRTSCGRNLGRRAKNEPDCTPTVKT